MWRRRKKKTLLEEAIETAEFERVSSVFALEQIRRGITRRRARLFIWCLLLLACLYGAACALFHFRP
jgi:hypothetical protein